MENATTSYQIHRSRLLFFLLVFIYGGASCCVFLLPFYLLWKFLLLVFCVGAFGYQWWSYVFFRNKNAYVSLSYVGEGRWRLRNIHHHEITALLQKSSVIWSYCIILHFRDEMTRRFCALVIFYDAMLAQDFRHLKVCVRAAK